MASVKPDRVDVRVPAGVRVVVAAEEDRPPVGDQSGLAASRFHGVSCLGSVPSTLTANTAACSLFLTRVHASRLPSGDHCDWVSYASFVRIPVVRRFAPDPSALAMKIP